MILRVEKLTKSFGGLSAVNNVDLVVKAQDLHAIIGPNGAGKTTFFNLLTGNLTPDSGKVIYRGDDITGFPPYRIYEKGMSRLFQVASIFPMLSVFENVQVAMFSKKGKSLSLLSNAKKTLTDETQRVLQDLGLVDKVDLPAGQLSHGDRKLLELGMVLAAEPELLLLDEPTAGMSPEETLATTKLIARLRNEKGITIIFTEHDMSVVFDIANRITVMHQGILVADGTPEAVKANEQVQRIYLGEEVA